MTSYPDDATLLARGKYATLGAKRRDHMKQLHDCMGAITDQARVVLRYDEDAPTALAVFMAMQGRMQDAERIIADLTEIQSAMDDLKSIAWGKA